MHVPHSYIIFLKQNSRKLCLCKFSKETIYKVITKVADEYPLAEETDCTIYFTQAHTSEIRQADLTHRHKKKVLEF